MSNHSCRQRRTILADDEIMRPDVSAMPVSALTLSTRTCNLLVWNSVTTLGNLILLSERDLLRLPHCGPKSVLEPIQEVEIQAE